MAAGGGGRKNSLKQRNQEMAAHLVRIGYPHGRRASVTHAPPIPKMTDIGSAAYRRRTAK